MSRRMRAVCAALVITASVLALAPARADDSQGTEFWLGFAENFGAANLSLFITSEAGAGGTVEVPGLGFSEDFVVAAGDLVTVTLPPEAMATGDGVQDKAVRVTADDEVTVYGLNQRTASTDAYLGLPVDTLGTEYMVLAPAPTSAHTGDASEVVVVATEDATTATLTLTAAAGGQPAATPYQVVLDAGQLYQVKAPGADLSGSVVTADKPVAVLAGDRCTNVPGNVSQFCDHVVEQIPPASAWGQEFLSVPLATREGGDTFRVLAGTDGTTVSVNGTTVATLDRSEVHEQIIEGAATITTSEPALVAQLSNSTGYDGVTSDPFMMLVPPYEQYLTAYTVSTPASGIGTNFVNVVAPDSAVGAVTLDGSPIPPESFTPIGASGFSGAQVDVGIGAHRVESPQPTGVFSYGFDNADSYGYPGGMSVSPVASAADVELAPEAQEALVESEACVTATVTDQDGAPLEGIRVDFDVAGVHPHDGIGFTGADGGADHCYTGTDEGVDTVEASVGSLADSATITWSTCLEDGLAALVGTPAEGVASGTVHGLEPSLGPLGEPVHELSCTVVVPLEDAVDGLTG